MGCKSCRKTECKITPVSPKDLEKELKEIQRDFELDLNDELNRQEIFKKNMLDNAIGCYVAAAIFAYMSLCAGKAYIKAKPEDPAINSRFFNTRKEQSTYFGLGAGGFALVLTGTGNYLRRQSFKEKYLEDRKD